MFHRVRSLVNTLLAAALLPLAVLSLLCDWLKLRRRRNQRSSEPAAVAAAPFIGEFQFERAIEAYQAVIDAALEEDRL